MLGCPRWNSQPSWEWVDWDPIICLSDLFFLSDLNIALFLVIVCLSVLSVCLSVCPSICPVCLSLSMSLSLSVCLSVCLSVLPTVCLSVFLPVCLTVCLCVFCQCLNACVCESCEGRWHLSMFYSSWCLDAAFMCMLYNVHLMLPGIGHMFQTHHMVEVWGAYGDSNFQMLHLVGGVVMRSTIMRPHINFYANLYV